MTNLVEKRTSLLLRRDNFTNVEARRVFGKRPGINARGFFRKLYVNSTGCDGLSAPLAARNTFSGHVSRIIKEIT